MKLKFFIIKKQILNFLKNKKEIHIKNFGQEKVVFFDSNLKDWSIFFLKIK